MNKRGKRDDSYREYVYTYDSYNRTPRQQYTEAGSPNRYASIGSPRRYTNNGYRNRSQSEDSDTSPKLYDAWANHKINTTGGNNISGVNTGFFNTPISGSTNYPPGNSNNASYRTIAEDGSLLSPRKAINRSPQFTLSIPSTRDGCWRVDNSAAKVNSMDATTNANTVPPLDIYNTVPGNNTNAGCSMDNNNFRSNNTIVRSYGIACFRRNHLGKLEVLMVKRRISYEFTEFVLCKYTNKTVPPGLFDKMFVEEKIDLLSLDFSRIWYRLYLDRDGKDPSYIRKKNKFEKNFLFDNGRKLSTLIQKSKSQVPNELWELPKGRRRKDNIKRNYDESEIECAAREFEEETGIKKSMYKIIPNAYSTYTFIDGGITYICKYYLTIATSNFIPEDINFNNLSQIKEISAVRWADIDMIRFLSRTNSSSVSNLENFIVPLFRRAKTLIIQKNKPQVINKL